MGFRKDFVAQLVLTILLLVCERAISGDRCPEKSVLHPCTCREQKKRAFLEDSAKSLEHITDSEAKNLTVLDRLVETSGVKHNALDTLGNFTLKAAPPAVRDSSYTIVECKSPKTLAALEDAIANGLHRLMVDRLSVFRVPPAKEHILVHLPKAWLANTRIRQLEILDTPLFGDFIFYGNPFEGQTHSLVSLKISGCDLYGTLTHDTLGTVNTKGLNSLPKLEIVDFTRNRLVHISNTAFRYPPTNLTTVILTQNSIRQIEASAFSYIPGLKIVDLSHNLLTYITRNIFATSSKDLEEIHLKWNRIQTLPADFFNNMPSLRKVDVSKNFLYSLPAKPWSIPWKQLSFVGLEGNFLECNCDLLWLVNMTTATNSSLVKNPAEKQTILGTCSYTKNFPFSKKYQLANLTRSDINC